MEQAKHPSVDLNWQPSQTFNPSDFNPLKSSAAFGWPLSRNESELNRNMKFLSDHFLKSDIKTRNYFKNSKSSSSILTSEKQICFNH